MTALILIALVLIGIVIAILLWPGRSDGPDDPWDEDHFI